MAREWAESWARLPAGGLIRWLADPLADPLAATPSPAANRSDGESLKFLANLTLPA